MRVPAVALIWLVALAAAVIAYVFGANFTLATAWAFLGAVDEALDQWVQNLSAQAASIIPALAIGAIVAFVPLTILAIRAGQRGRMALVCIPGMFLWLAGRDASRMEWTQALLLAGVGALVMSARLRSGTAVSVRVRR